MEVSFLGEGKLLMKQDIGNLNPRGPPRAGSTATHKIAPWQITLRHSWPFFLSCINRPYRYGHFMGKISCDL